MPGKASYANVAVLLDVSRKTRDLRSNGLGLHLAGVGVLAPFGKGDSNDGSFGNLMYQSPGYLYSWTAIGEQQTKSSHDSHSLKSKR